MIYAENMELIGYHDLDGRPGLKLAMQEVDDRFYLYVAPIWHQGWAILDVTDPRNPTLERWIDGPPNTWTEQVQVADGLMVTGLEHIHPLFRTGGKEEPEEGILIWDVSDPVDPKQLAHWRTGASGTHRNYYDGGRYVHAAMTMPGYVGHIYGALDIEDPEHPRLAGQWWIPGQHEAGGETLPQRLVEGAQRNHPFPDVPAAWLHGGAYATGDRVYCPWSRGGMVLLDIEDVEQPRHVSTLEMWPPLGSSIAVHTVVPIPERKLAVLNSEALQERGAEPEGYVALADMSDESDPQLLSLFPKPEVPEGYPFADFTQKGGRFGPHNQHQPQHQACLQPTGDYIYVAYFNAGLQVFDISNPRAPKVAGYCIPEDPETRNGPLPTDLVIQVEDVLVDRRGYIYCSEKNSGLYVMEFTPPARR